MSYIYQSLITISLLGISLCSGIYHHTWTADPAIRDVITKTNQLATHEPVSRLQCANRCTDTSDCVSFFYTTTTQRCQLHTDSFPLGATQDFVQESGTKFYVTPCSTKGYTYNAIIRKFYIVFLVSLSKCDAETLCNNRNGTLIHFSGINPQEFKPILELLITSASASSIGFWTGATYDQTTRGFVWPGGEPVQSGYWYPGQPQFDDEHPTECVAIIPLYDYRLDDISCQSIAGLELYPICECVL